MMPYDAQLLIAAVIPTYNSAKFIDETLSAVFDQRRPPEQIVVVDDGSTDDTADRAQRWADQRQAPLILVRQANQGASAARNTGIRAATADLIATIDADDVVLPNHLETLAAGFRLCPELDLCFGDAEAFAGDRITRRSYLQGSPICQLPADDQGNGFRVIRGSAYAGIVVGNRIPTSATLYRRQAALDAGLYNPGFPRCNDREFLMRMSRGTTFGYFNVIVERIRKHDDNLTHRRHHYLHLEQQIRALQSMLDQRETLALDPREVLLTRDALARVRDKLCVDRSRAGLAAFANYLLQSVPRGQRPSLRAALPSLARSLYHALPMRQRTN